MVSDGGMNTWLTNLGEISLPFVTLQRAVPLDCVLWHTFSEKWSKKMKLRMDFSVH